MQINKLKRLYISKHLSAGAIAKIYNCSENKVNYWLRKHDIKKRTISEAVYVKHNPHGDPFHILYPSKLNDAILYGIGLGLYWGEGTKSNKYAIRLGNTNPEIISKFIEFLIKIYGINTSKLRFGLQVFSDVSPKAALKYWSDELGMPTSQFYKVVVTPTRGEGTYRNKLKYGVLTVYFHNKKLRDALCQALENL